MKRLLLTTLVLALTTTISWAVPAKPGATRIQQPDGSFITVSLHGDEYLHYTTTSDGYSVVRNSQGCYVYAEQRDGQLVPTTMRAHDPSERTSREQNYLLGVDKYLKPAITPRADSLRQDEYSRRAKARVRHREPEYDYNKFRGLIILVQFNDREFSRENYTDILEDMVNEEDYKGYDNTNNGRFTGSVRDYFYDNSCGRFTPQFDIVGPVTVKRSQYYAKGTDNAIQLVLDAIDAADDEVDFSLYDGDDDGVVDLVYFIFAGLGSNVNGNDERLVWPHAGAVYNPNGGYDEWSVVRDGTLLWRYACSTELYGSNNWSILDGIGTICHEFSHVLGLPDFYDTNYGDNGQSNHPDTWSVMSGGSYLNNGRTPVGYTLYERYAIGFATPTVIDKEGSYSLSPIGSSNTGFRLNTRVDKEYFLLENRQKTDKWDRYLPGHGLLVFRVDSTNALPWFNNQVNCNPKHNYFELVRAGGGQGAVNNEYGALAKSSDPFPGTKNVTELNNTTTPANLLTWAGEESPFGLANITEDDGTISFDVEDVNYLRAIALPDSVEMAPERSIALTLACLPSYGIAENVVWTSSNTDVATIDNTGLLTSLSEGETLITAVTVNKRQEVLSATCRLVVKQHLRVPDIVSFNSMERGTMAELNLNNAQVLYVYDGTIYLRDDTGALTISEQALDVKTNDMLSGTIYGIQGSENRIPTISPDKKPYSVNISVTTEGIAAAKPLPVNIDSIINDCHYANLLTLKKVKLERSDGGIWAVGRSDRRIKLWNTFQLSKISVPKTIENKRFDVTGILMTRLTDDALNDELALMAAVVEVPYDPAEDDVQGIGSVVNDNGDNASAVYTPDGRRLNNAVGDHRRPGLYIVKKGQKVMKVVSR